MDMKTNRLLHEASPYLRQHAVNPVDWYPWGCEAFQKAEAEDKPVFLSIGYSACHWCHVMARESFADEEVAEILNRAFVSVKVDREERPDVDGIYMEVCRRMTGSGGWPLTVFLTPGKKPFFAGTYYPKRAVYGRPGLIELLTIVEKEWKSNRAAILRNADTITARLNEADEDEMPHKKNTSDGHFEELRRSFDTVWGGFGRAPKFPMPSDLLFLAEYGKERNALAHAMLFKTLDAMAAGGIFDHIGGGFARYSTDRKWLVPHFEKMLYDNAQLLRVYTLAYTLSGKALYKDIAERISFWIKEEMRHSGGGFYSAQDADSGGGEGLYYLFTPEEAEAVLGKSAGRRFAEAHDITGEGNFEGKSIPNLIKREPDDGNKGEYRKEAAALYRYRKNRMELRTDDKILSFWNALAIEAYAEAYKATSEKEYLDLAAGAYAYVKEKLTDSKTVYTAYRDGKRSAGGVLDDAAAFISAAIALYQATQEERYLTDAEAHTRRVQEEYWDSENGGYFFTSASGEQLIVRRKEIYDGVTPSGSALMYYNLIRLGELTAKPGYAGTAEKLEAFMDTQNGAGSQGYYQFAKIKKEAYSRVLCVLPDDVEKEAFFRQERNALFAYDYALLSRPSETFPLLQDKPTYYICKNGVCKQPTNRI